MNGALAGKTALVTGGSRGIGRAIVESFVAAGATVFFTYLSGQAEADFMLAETDPNLNALHPVKADVSDEHSILNLFEQIDAHGHLVILVNNAGVILEKPLLDTSVEEFDWLLNINLRGMFLCGREGLKRMAGRPGRVINISSDLSFTGRESFSIYCASKGAINALTKSWAREFSPEVLVNAIAPGPIETDMLDIENMSPEWRLKEEELTQLKRIGKAGEVSSLALFLAGDGASYLTGQIIGPNGGSVMP